MLIVLNVRLRFFRAPALRISSFMTILERIDAELKEAMKARHELALSTLRLVRSALKNAQIDLGHAPTDDEALAVLKTIQKQYRDALTDFEKAGRTDLAERQKEELAIVQKFLPAALPEAEVERMVKEAIATTSATTAADVGKVMGAAMKLAGGRADGNVVRTIAQKLLSGA
jgi:uncharacterized protein